MTQQIPKAPQARLPVLGVPMRPVQAGGGGAWNYPVNPFELQKELEGGIEHHKAGRAEDAAADTSKAAAGPRLRL